MFIERIKDPYFKERFAHTKKKIQKQKQGIAEDDPADWENVRKLVKELRAPYFPPDRLIRIDEKNDIPDNMAVPSQVMDYFIKNSSHRFIFNFCICRDANECTHYPIDLGCMFIGEASKQLHPELGHSADIDEALAHAQKWRDAGLSLHLGYVPFDAEFFKAAPSTRFMSICGCCPCCCATTRLPYQKMPGIEIRVSEHCTGCGLCAEECIPQAIEIKDGKAHIHDNCRGCGRCVDLCPEDAVEVVVVDPAYVQKTIEWVSAKVDVT